MTVSILAEFKYPLPPFQMQLNISCKRGSVELIFGVLKNNIRLTIAGPWGYVADLISNSDEKLRKPAFRNYDDLRNILKSAFEIYEDFKRALLKNYGNSN